jgi:pimeloyl-ACP methyl ester carboxylesterase
MILHAAEAGEGRPVVLLHGLFGRSQNLAYLAKRLAARQRVISLDLRNHGASAHATDMSYPTMAEDVRETLVKLGAWPACALGHSMGGKVAMMLALLYPDHVEKLVVADIAPVPYAHRNRIVADALRAVALVPGLARTAASDALAPSIPQAAVRGFLLQNLVLGERPHWRIGLAEIAGALDEIEGWPAHAVGLSYSHSACFIVGANSNFVLPEHQPAIRTMFPRCRLMTIQNAGHWLHADQPEAFVAAVEGVLF